MHREQGRCAIARVSQCIKSGRFASQVSMLCAPRCCPKPNAYFRRVGPVQGYGHSADIFATRCEAYPLPSSTMPAADTSVCSWPRSLVTSPPISVPCARRTIDKSTSPRRLLCLNRAPKAQPADARRRDFSLSRRPCRPEVPRHGLGTGRCTLGPVAGNGTRPWNRCCHCPSTLSSRFLESSGEHILFAILVAASVVAGREDRPRDVSSGSRPGFASIVQRPRPATTSIVHPWFVPRLNKTGKSIDHFMMSITPGGHSRVAGKAAPAPCSRILLSNNNTFWAKMDGRGKAQ